MISIIVPVYNIEKYLPHCVKSLLGQTYKDIEILLVNDGSGDGSGALCNSLAASDPKVRVIHKENGGLSDARNAGLNRARGEWILFVDGDDFLAENAVECLMAEARPDVDFVQFGYCETEDVRWSPPKDQRANPVVCTDVGSMWRWLYEKGGVAASSCTKLWNRQIFDGVRFQKGILHEDEELLNRVLPKCRKVVYTDLVLYGYVMRGGSIIHSGFRPKSMDIFPIMDQRAEVLEASGLPELAVETRSRMFQTAAWQYCLARRGGFKQEAATLKRIAVKLAKVRLTLGGQYKILHRAAGVTSAAMDMYYLFRRICGKS